ncbi:hypothetical protein L1887_48562 [Cichorium endivia]|nr:hypothetical protein L1887_48562 [Cichorium endivia]
MQKQERADSISALSGDEDKASGQLPGQATTVGSRAPSKGKSGLPKSRHAAPGGVEAGARKEKARAGLWFETTTEVERIWCLSCASLPSPRAHLRLRPHLRHTTDTGP